MKPLPRTIRAILTAAAALLVVAITVSLARQPTARPDAAAAHSAPASVLPAITPRLQGTPPARTPVPLALRPVDAAPTPTPRAASEITPVLNRYLNELVAAGLFQGVALIARDGQVLLDKGYGMADAERGTPNTPQTRFRLASMTKQFTAMGVLILQSRGRLDVGDPICNYLDDCPATWRAITIHHLLSHTSGLPNYTDFPSFDQTQATATTAQELAARFRDLPLLFAPGTSYVYENSDYVLLGLIIERASGQPYADFLRDAIFAPLGMRDTGVAQGVSGAGEAVGYHKPGERAKPLDASTLFSAGGLFSTAEDLYRWDQALASARLLPKPLMDQLWTQPEHGYSYGWLISDSGGRRKISHPGLMDGFGTVIARYPDDRVTVIVLSNMSAGDVVGISDYLASLVFDS